ncbi:MAG: hypothetical protein CTY36_01555 [Methylocystis sp.]|nr:MAG: hypothetical protein CTY36_01555 [Methylocystis sp.]
MTKLKLSVVPDERPVKLTVELPAALHRDLKAYADILARETGQTLEPSKLIAPMLVRFIASDRGFVKARNGAKKTAVPAETASRLTIDVAGVSKE